MPKNYLSVLNKHIIQVENKNVGLKVCVCVWGGGGGGDKHTIAPKQKSKHTSFSQMFHKIFSISF